MRELKQIAVLLTCHNRKDKTIRCLKHLYACSVPAGFRFDVFLVDDNSTDNTASEVKKRFPDVNLIPGNGQLYWNGGMRLAWSVAAKKGYDYYLWLNDDTNLFENAILELVDVFKIKGAQSIVCGITKSEFSDKITYSGLVNGKLLIPNGTIQECDSFNGNVVLISDQVYKEVGNLDNAFSHSIGDIDYGLRAKKRGIKSYATSASVGFCENNPQLPLWCRPENPLSVRIKHLYSPLGYCTPNEYFVFENRHYGTSVAIKHYFTIHLRLLFPKLWKA